MPKTTIRTALIGMAALAVMSGAPADTGDKPPCIDIEEINLAEVRENGAILISGGSASGLYSHTASKIAGFLETQSINGVPLEVVVACSSGSGKNIERLQDGTAQMAIVQSDTLHKEVLRQRTPSETSDAANPNGITFQPIASLFPEYTQILVSRNSDIESVIQLVDKAVFIGKQGSGAEENALNIFRMAGVVARDETCEEERDQGGQDSCAEDQKFRRILELEVDGVSTELSNTSAMVAVRDGELDAAVRVTGSVFPKLVEWRDDLKLLNLDSSLQSSILNTFPYYGTVAINIDGQSFNTLYTRAVLVASDELNTPEYEAVVRNLTRFIHKELPVEFQRGRNDGNAAIFTEDKLAGGLPLDFHPQASSYFQEHGLMFDRERRLALFFGCIWVIIFVIKWIMDIRTPWEQRLYARKGPALARILEFTVGQLQWLLSMLLDALKSFWKSILNGSFFHSTLTVAVLGLIAFLLVATITILHFEGVHAENFDIPNEFETMSIGQFLLWLLQILAMGDSPGGVFPKSFEAQAVTVILPIVGVLGGVLAVLLSSMKERSAKERRARGMEMEPLSNHIVLCGWNGHADRVIDEITTYIPGDRPRHLAVLAQSKLDKPMVQLGHDSESVHYLRGMSSERENLERVSAQKAQGFLVLAGEEKINKHNFRSIFTVQMLDRLLTANKKKPRPKVMVDMVFKENLELFVVAGADRVLNTRLIGTVFLAYSALNMGFSNVITNLMSQSTRPVICRVNNSDHKKIFRKAVGKNFSSAWHTLFNSGVNLLAIFPAGGEPSATLGIYPDLPNPLIIGEDDYIVGEDDSLVVIENQRLEAEHVNAVSFADSNRDVQSGLDHNIPLVVVDRHNEVGDDLRQLLRKKCSMLYYLSTEVDPGVESGCQFIHWDGDVRSITELVQNRVLTDLDRRGLKDKLKFLIPTLVNPLNFDTTEAVHKDDETVALILQLKTIDKGNFHYTAEIHNMQNLRLFKAVGVQQPIPVHEFASLALAQMTLFDGEVTGLILRLMENFFTGELEDKSLRKIAVNDVSLGKRLVGLNYNEAAEVLFGVGIQLISIISHQDQEHENQLVALPHRADDDFDYRIDIEDELFVIS